MMNMHISITVYTCITLCIYVYITVYTCITLCIYVCITVYTCITLCMIAIIICILYQALYILFYFFVNHFCIEGHRGD